MTSQTVQKTTAQELERLANERSTLVAALRRPGGDSPEGRARITAVQCRLRELEAVPPPGYVLAKTAADLVAHALEHGWLALVQWTPPDYEGEPFVTVQVGRLLREGEQPDARGNRWTYRLTWHSRDCAAGKVRLFGRCLATTPDRPATHDGPSLKAIRAVITQHATPHDGGAQ